MRNQDNTQDKNSTQFSVKPAIEPIDLAAYWRSVTKRKWQIMFLSLAVALLAAVIVFMMTPRYVSTVTLHIEQEGAKIVSVEDVYNSVNSSKEHYTTQAEIIKSREVVESVVRKLNLTQHPLFQSVKEQSGFVSEFSQLFGFRPDERQDINDEKRRHEFAIKKLYQDMAVSPVRLTLLIKVSFESSDPELAARIANAIANAYIERDIESRMAMTQQANSWLNERVAILKQTLEESEQALQAYREQEGLVDSKDLAYGGSTAVLQGATASLVEAKVELASARSVYNQLKKHQGKLDTVPALLSNPLVAKLKEVLAEQERKVSELGKRYGPEHNKMIQAQAELQQARDNLQLQLRELAASVEREYEMAREKVSALQSTVAQAKSTIKRANRHDFKLESLKREVESNRQMYTMFMERLKETNVATDVRSNVVARVIEAAVPASQPSKPKKKQVIAIAFVLALFLGCVASILQDRLDNTIKTGEEVESYLSQPLLASFPLLKKKEQHGSYYLTHPRSVFAESVRSARTGLMLTSIDVEKKTFVITSSVPGEGKTTTAMNLALAYSQTEKTLLIDADMRRPSIAKSFSLDAAHPGLSTLVTGRSTVEDCLQQVENSELKVITSGPIPPNPLELLLSPKFKACVDKLAENFDVIILDAPPVQLVSDAIVMAADATGVIFVVKADDTTYKVAQKSIQLLSSGPGVNVVGVALNMLDYKKLDRYYGGETGYANYGYSGYYSQNS